MAQIAQYHGEIIGVEIPASVELTDHPDRAGRAGRPGVSGARKPAELETGKTMQVPLFVEHRATASGSTPAPATTSPASE